MECHNHLFHLNGYIEMYRECHDYLFHSKRFSGRSRSRGCHTHVCFFSFIDLQFEMKLLSKIKFEYMYTPFISHAHTPTRNNSHHL